MNILFLGDVVGKPGRTALTDRLGELKERLSVDICIVNGENSAGGSGITSSTGSDMFAAGADVITSGDHIWRQKDVRQYLKDKPQVIRPANFPEDAPGSGMAIVRSTNGIRTAVINLQGRTFMSPIDCPFKAVDTLLGTIPPDVNVIVVDMHAEATSDKIAMGRFLDGRVTAVLGTHTHVQTADEQIFPGGTAFICDAGMVGPYESILGRKIGPVVKSFTTQLPTSFEVGSKDVRIAGVLICADPETGKAVSIERIMEKI